MNKNRCGNMQQKKKLDEQRKQKGTERNGEREKGVLGGGGGVRTDDPQETFLPHT
jgi:hypothetical protein